MKFKGKVGVWVWLLLAGLNIFLLNCLLALPEGDKVSLGIVLFSVLIVDSTCIPAAVKNYVEIDGGKLIQVVGFGRDTIEIHEITEVYRTHNPIASGAMSLDRIMIKGRKREMLISIHEKEKFFSELKRLNPSIFIH